MTAIDSGRVISTILKHDSKITSYKIALLRAINAVVPRYSQFERTMTRIIYNKLIRDRIPEIITAEGKQFSIETMPEEEYEQALRQKLMEEAQEAAQASPEKLVTELADLYEVIDALLIVHGISQKTVFQVQQQRHHDRGGFEKRLKLLWVCWISHFRYYHCSCE